MNRRACSARSDLEHMLLDETAKPKALPLSLLEDITGDFSDDQQIGSGGFAVVYKGILGDRAVAVKRLSQAYMHEKQFHREVECLMRVKHKNIVRFLGYCADTQGNMGIYEGKLVMADVQQRLLCFEYLPTGSLDKYILDAHREWGTCYGIIKGICEGIQYLHENNIIHLDLKPANILLDNKMIPKITDFGMSRCFDENQSRHITQNIAGTMGYLAPELLVGGIIARSADLYSFGVIIIVILTGQKGYEAIENVLESWSDRLEKSQRRTFCKQIEVCYEIAFECIEFNPKKRPAGARDIIVRLHEMESIQSLDSNQSPPLNDHQQCSVKSQQNIPVEKHHEKASSPSPNSPVLSLLPGHDKYLCADNNGNCGGLNHSKRCLPSDSMVAAFGSCTLHEMVDDEDTTRKIEEVVHHFSHRIFTDDDNIGQNFFTSHNIDSVCNDPQQSNGISGLKSSAVMEKERNGSRTPVDYLEDNCQYPDFPRIPHSCLLPIMDSAEEPGTSRTATRVDFGSAAETRGENRNRQKSGISAAKNPPKVSSKFSDVDVLPDRRLVSGLNRVSRCSSLKEAPSPRQPDASVDKINEGKPSNSKGRRSPLSRMLDPLLRSRQTSTSVPVQPSFVQKCHLPSNINKQSLNLEGSGSQNVQRMPVDAVVDPNNRAEANTNQSPSVLLNIERYLQQERDSRARRQALLQLAWKNGLPLFMLSFGDSDILAATVRRKGISDSDDLESAYTFFSVEEPKKKSGAWITVGNKIKKHQLVSSIIGELRISRRKSRCFHTQDFHTQREFVLVGSELLPTPAESSDSHIRREIGAFISTVSQTAESRYQLSSQNSGRSSSAPIGCSCPPLGNFHPKMTNITNSSSASVIAILPNGIHCARTSGQPLPLIDRWRSGGSCDCGGWDEGCMLSVLTDDNTQETKSRKSIQENQTQDGSHRFDLITQGRSREDRHAFSMVSSKEGLYTVEFSSSIALLQAFATCIVMLHDRCPIRTKADMPAPKEHTTPCTS